MAQWDLGVCVCEGLVTIVTADYEHCYARMARKGSLNLNNDDGPSFRSAFHTINHVDTSMVFSIITRLQRNALQSVTQGLNRHRGTASPPISFRTLRVNIRLRTLGCYIAIALLLHGAKQVDLADFLVSLYDSHLNRGSPFSEYRFLVRKRTILGLAYTSETHDRLGLYFENAR